MTKEVNEDKNFAQLRQVYNSLILATWYKKKIKDSILEQVYADKNKVAGVNIDDPQEKQKIYEKYLQAFKKGVYNYIKEEQDPLTQEIMPRKYFSGGVFLRLGETSLAADSILQFIHDIPNGVWPSKDHAMLIIESRVNSEDHAMNIINPLEGLVKVNGLRDVWEHMLMEHEVVKTVPNGKERIMNIVNILAQNWQDPELALQKANAYLNFKEDKDWQSAQTDFMARRNELNFRFTYPELIASVPSGGKVLDFGAGSGDTARYIAQARSDISVVGTDIDYTSQKTNPPNMKISIMTSPVKISEPDNSFDLIVMNYVLHHVDPGLMDALLKEIRRVAKPGARIFIREPTYSTQYNVNNPYSNRKLSQYFKESLQKYGEGLGRGYLALTEWSATFLAERRTWPMPYNFHSMEEWIKIFSHYRMSPQKIEFFSFQTAFDNQGLGAMQPRGDIIFDVDKDNEIKDNAQLAKTGVYFAWQTYRP